MTCPWRGTRKKRRALQPLVNCDLTLQKELNTLMFGRIWHGWTKPENADNYERLLKEEIFPGIAAGIDAMLLGSAARDIIHDLRP